MPGGRRSGSTDDRRPADPGVDVEVGDLDVVADDDLPAEPPVDVAPGEQESG